MRVRRGEMWGESMNTLDDAWDEHMNTLRCGWGGVRCGVRAWILICEVRVWIRYDAGEDMGKRMRRGESMNTDTWSESMNTLGEHMNTIRCGWGHGQRMRRGESIIICRREWEYEYDTMRVMTWARGWGGVRALLFGGESESMNTLSEHMNGIRCGWWHGREDEAGWEHYYLEERVRVWIR